MKVNRSCSVFICVICILDIHMSYIHNMYIIDPSDQALFHLLAWPPWAVPVELEL